MQFNAAVTAAQAAAQILHLTLTPDDDDDDKKIQRASSSASIKIIWQVLVGSKSQRRRWEDYSILSNQHERRNTNSFLVEQQQSVLPETARHTQCQDLLYINKQPHLFVTTSSSITTSSGKQDDQARLYSFPRSSFCHTRPNSTSHEDFVPNSPVFPTYMAATESAKAKARSVSTPRQRLLTQLNGLSPHSS